MVAVAWFATQRVLLQQNRQSKVLLLILANTLIHRGKLVPSGTLNVLEEFEKDQEFSDFLDFYSRELYWQRPVHLILNGNFFNLLLIDDYGVYAHQINEEISLQSLKKIVFGHPKLFTALKNFLSTPHKRLSFIFGEYDMGLIFPKVQKFLISIIGDNIDFHGRLVIGPVVVAQTPRWYAPQFRRGERGEQCLQLTLAQHLAISSLPASKKLFYPPLALSRIASWRWRGRIFLRQVLLILAYSFSGFRNFWVFCLWYWGKIWPSRPGPSSHSSVGTVYSLPESTWLKLDDRGRWVINLAGSLAQEQTKKYLWHYAVVELDLGQSQVKNYALLEWRPR